MASFIIHFGFSDKIRLKMEYQGHDLGWLVFTVTMGGIAAIYGFFKRANQKYLCCSSFPLDDMACGSSFIGNIFSFLKAIAYVDDPISCCTSHGDHSDCLEFQFSSWEERIISAKKRERKVGFYLKKKATGKYALAVVGKQSIVSHMSYEVCGSFARKYAPHLSPRQALKWNTKREMMDWLSTLITKPNTEVVQQVQYTKEGNSFFKVLVGEFHDHLNIPATYLQKYDNIKGGSMRLRNGEREWNVEVDGRVIKGGWNNFVKDHKLREGDFLLFTALSEMFFNVAIFGQNGRIKEFPWFHAFNPDGRVVYV